MSTEMSAYTPFDSLRHIPEIRRMGRADIVFGPDMFDPRIEESGPVFSDALYAAVREGALADLGIGSEDDLGKTVGEVSGYIEPAEMMQHLIEVSKMTEPYLPTGIPRKGFLNRLLPFMSR